MNYKKNMSKPILQLRLVHYEGEHYILQFRTTGWFSRWFHRWVTVPDYFPTCSSSRKPGDDMVFGVWHQRLWKIENNAHGEELMEGFRNTLKTVGDIYHTFIEPGEIQMKEDYDRYEEYTRKRNSVNSVFD